MIVLVTGSRFAKPSEHGKTIRGALLWAVGARDGQFGDHELWHGVSVGVDEISGVMAREDFGWAVRAWPADWSRCQKTAAGHKTPKAGACHPGHRKLRSDGVTEYCPTAGFRRNQKMVDALSKVDGRKVVVGFPIPALGSRGTVDCLTRALHAGLPVVSVPLKSEDAL